VAYAENFRGGAKGAMPPKFLENIVILCFERRFSKQNSVIRLKLNILDSLHCWIHFFSFRVWGGAMAQGQRGHNSPGAESLRGHRKIPTMSQVLSSIQCICFRKTSGSNVERQTWFLPRAPSNLVTPLPQWQHWLQSFYQSRGETFRWTWNLRKILLWSAGKTRQFYHLRFR